MSRRRTERKNLQVLGFLGQSSVRAFGGTDQLDAGALRVNSSVKTISMALDDSVPDRSGTESSNAIETVLTKPGAEQYMHPLLLHLKLCANPTTFSYHKIVYPCKWPGKAR